MGDRARHVRKFMGGRRTPQEVHQAWAFPPHATCYACSRRPLVRAITMAQVDDAKRKWPEIAKLTLRALMDRIVMIKGADGQGVPYVRIGIAYACAECRSTMEKTLAKLPSWVLVEINAGPEAPKVISSGA